MTATYGYHVQIPQPRWVEGVDRQPAGAWNKSVDNVHTLQEAKQHNPATFTLHRKWYDTGQVFGGDWAANCERARVFFNTFVDATFRQLAPSVDAISEFNEYLANSQSVEEVQQRIMWVQASQWVWANEYRNQPGFEHIRLASCASAVGNDIHVDMARAVADNGGLLDYHVYTAVRAGSTRNLVPARLESLSTHPPRAKFTGTSEPYFVTPPPGWFDSYRAPEGVIAPDEWQWYSGRYTMMDAQFVAAGVYVDWIFGEGGAVLQYDHGGLGPLDGWRHPDVYGGNVSQYLEMMKYWLDKTAEFNHYNNNRAKGAVLFTTGGPGSTWDLFEVLQPEINIIADYMRNYIPPEFPPVEPPPVEPPPEETMKELLHEVTINPANADTNLVEIEFIRDGERQGLMGTTLPNQIDGLVLSQYYQTEDPPPPPLELPALVVDASGHQKAPHTLNVATAKANGIDGFLFRTSNGILTDTDPDEDESYDENGHDRKIWNHLQQAKDNNVPFGLYHFYNGGWGTEQINHWMGIVEEAISRGYNPSLGLWLDFETTSPDGEVEIMAGCLAALDQNNTTQPIGIYTGGWWWNSRVSAGSAWPTMFNIWAANWVSNNPISQPPAQNYQYIMPHHWSRPANVWQFTSKGGQIAGHSSDSLDVNWFYGLEH